MRRVVLGENDRVGPWIEENGGGHYRPGVQCIGLERDGELVAGALFDYHNGASIYGHWAVSDKRALGRDFLSAIFRYPFVQLDCAVIIGLIAGDNAASLEVAEHLGFTLEHTIEGAHPSGELHIYTMRRNDCRWIDS